MSGFWYRFKSESVFGQYWNMGYRQKVNLTNIPKIYVCMYLLYLFIYLFYYSIVLEVSVPALSSRESWVPFPEGAPNNSIYIYIYFYIYYFYFFKYIYMHCIIFGE